MRNGSAQLKMTSTTKDATSRSPAASTASTSYALIRWTSPVSLGLAANDVIGEEPAFMARVGVQLMRFDKKVAMIC